MDGKLEISLFSGHVKIWLQTAESSCTLDMIYSIYKITSNQVVDFAAEEVRQYLCG